MANPSRVSTNAAAAGDASGSTASTGDVLGRALALIEDGEGPSCTFRTRTRGTSTWYFHVISLIPTLLSHGSSRLADAALSRVLSCTLVHIRSFAPMEASTLASGSILMISPVAPYTPI